MHPSPRALVATAEGSGSTDDPKSATRSRFSAELDRRGLFLRLGRIEAYLCAEADRAWGLYREPGGFDAQAGRLHLIIGTAPD